MIVLVPTRLELALLLPELRDVACEEGPAPWRRRAGDVVDVAVIGFGLAAAGARSAALLATRADAACLAGACGTYRPDEAPVGSVVAASRVEVDGLGFGRAESEDFVAAGEGDGALAAEIRAAPAATPAPVPAACGARAAGMLSVTSASGDRDHASARARRHPACAVEEMEAHAVLHAAAATGRAVAVLRGVSNVAGRRDPGAWSLAEAMAAVREALERWPLA